MQIQAKIGGILGRALKMREHIAEVENAEVENAGVDRTGGKCRSGKCRSRLQGWKMQERQSMHMEEIPENTLKYQTKYGCRGFLAYLLAEI